MKKELERMRDATVGVHFFFLTLEFLGALHLTKNTTSEIFESAAGLLFQWARDIQKRKIEKGDVLTHILVQQELLVAPEPDKISRRKCTPAVALLKIGYEPLCTDTFLGLLHE